MKKEPSEPAPIFVRNLQRKIACDRMALERFARRALLLCRQEPGAGLTSHGDLGVLVVSDRRMAQLHRRFMQIAGPTDVITFQHGEIFISVETAERQAAAYGTSLEHELRLYLVHGLLHLHGFDDHDPAARRRMHSVQERIVRLASRNTPGVRTLE
ncbi:MAG TPA: rRNA maturation RNase YbeY [Chthoniobacterales bacterium]|jgi:probable rRNA maturation factor|nr:rRNA maturation RNase YbeY [Chthoniobacterales bacterium]